MTAYLALLGVPVTIWIILAVSGEWTLLLHLISVSSIGIAYVVSFYGYGNVLNRLIPLSLESRAARIAGFLISGLSLLYFGFVILNLAGVFLQPVIVFLILTGTITGIFFFRKETGNLTWKSWPVSDRMLLSGILFLCGLQIVCAWTPLIFYDAIQYHILAPAHYLSAGRFVYIPLNFSTNMPMALQLVLGSSTAFDSSGESYKFLTTLLGWGMACAVAWNLKDFGRRTALLGALLTLGISGFWLPQALGVVDLPIAALMLCGCMFLYTGLGSGNVPVWIAPLCFGLAIGSRYPATLLTGIIYAIFSIHALHRRSIEPGRLIKILFIGFLIVFLTALPWILKNTVFTGNPVYPLFQKQLNGYEWSEQDAEILRRDTVGNRFSGLSRVQTITSLFRLLTSEKLVGALLMICAAVGLFRFPLHSREWLLCFTGWIGMLAWGWIHPLGGTNLTRFNAVVSLLFVVSSSVILSRSVWRIVLAASIVVVSAGLSFRSTDQLLDVLGSTTNSHIRLQTVRLNVPGWDAIDYANRTLNPETSRVFLLGETRSFFLRIPCFVSDAYHGTELAALFAGGPEQWRSMLGSRGITHILLSVPELNRLQTKNYLPLPRERLDELASWLRSLPILYQDGRGTFLFALPTEN